MQKDKKWTDYMVRRDREKSKNDEYFDDYSKKQADKEYENIKDENNKK